MQSVSKPLSESSISEPSAELALGPELFGGGLFATAFLPSTHWKIGAHPTSPPVFYNLKGFHEHTYRCFL